MEHRPVKDYWEMLPRDLCRKIDQDNHRHRKTHREALLTHQTEKVADHPRQTDHLRFMGHHHMSCTEALLRCAPLLIFRELLRHMKCET